MLTDELIIGNKIELSLAASHQPMLNQKLKERIAESLSRYLQQAIHLDINISDAELITPVKQEQHEHKERVAQATHTLMQDPHVKKLIDMYDATLEISFV